MAGSQSLRLGIQARVLAIFACRMLYLLESNTRSAGTIGIVGAGGLELHPSEILRVLAVT